MQFRVTAGNEQLAAVRFAVGRAPRVRGHQTAISPSRVPGGTSSEHSVCLHGGDAIIVRLLRVLLLSGMNPAVRKMFTYFSNCPKLHEIRMATARDSQPSTHCVDWRQETQQRHHSICFHYTTPSSGFSRMRTDVSRTPATHVCKCTVYGAKVTAQSRKSMHSHHQHSTLNSPTLTWSRGRTPGWTSCTRAVASHHAPLRPTCQQTALRLDTWPPLLYLTTVASHFPSIRRHMSGLRKYKVVQI